MYHSHGLEKPGDHPLAFASASVSDARSGARPDSGRGFGLSKDSRAPGEDSRAPESEQDSVESLALDADDSSDERDAEAAVSAYITTRKEVDL